MKLSLTSLLILLFCCFSILVKAQFTYAEVGVNGLTCSQCSRSVEMRIRKLEFVKDVEMNLEHTDGKIYFTNGKVDMERVAKAVVEAGFSVRSLKAGIILDKKNGPCFTYRGDTYDLVHAPATIPEGTVTVTFLGLAYQSKKEFRKWQSELTNSCTAVKGKLYYITL